MTDDLTEAKRKAVAAEYLARREAEADPDGRIRACLNAIIAARKPWIPYVVLAVQYGERTIAEMVTGGLVDRWDVTVKIEDDPIPKNQKVRVDRRVTLTPLAAERLHVELDEVIVMTADGPSDEAFWRWRVEIGSREDVQRPIVSPRYDREQKLPPFAELIPDTNRTIGGVDKAHDGKSSTRRQRRQLRRAG